MLVAPSVGDCWHHGHDCARQQAVASTAVPLKGPVPVWCGVHVGAVASLGSVA